MKTILLQFKNSHLAADDKPRRWTVDYESGDTIGISHVHKYSDGSKSESKYVITKQADGSYKSDTGCEYVVAKLDRRPKPFSVIYRSGIGEGSKTTKFATLAEVREYVKGRWNGVEYMDSPTCFHNDFGHFFLKNCALADLGQRSSSDSSSDLYWNWIWHTEVA